MTLPKNSPSSLTFPSERDLTMLAIGLLIDSAAIRARLASFATLPGEESESWRLLMNLAANPEKLTKFVANKISRYEAIEKEPGPLEARVMRTFVRREMQGRLEMAAYKHAQFVKFSMPDALEQAGICDALRSFLGPADKESSQPQGG